MKSTMIFKFGEIDRRVYSVKAGCFVIAWADFIEAWLQRPRLLPTRTLYNEAALLRSTYTT
jgi:hypothetical protein